MKKKPLMAAFTLALTLFTCPVSQANAYVIGAGVQETKCDPKDDILYSCSIDELPGGELTKYDLRVFPSKKTISTGQSFTLSIRPANESEFYGIPKEEWEEILAENVDSVTYRSEKSSVASVNKFSGKVTGRRSGYTTIRTEINLNNGDSVIYKTKVYVTSR